ncbi:hypothetical protein [Nocardia carnea]|uniref:hypothetical protein n=1 Tax=Nocardia carnea TaxID=37328 RepID=UPI002454A1ED|nr:hypothetical protein [Nocardia carnea]
MNSPDPGRPRGRAAAADHRAGVANRPRAAADPAGDPLVAALRRGREFFRRGWSFNTGLAERMPRVYFAGWSL